MSAQECIFLFETTHQAMWAEDVAREEGIPAEVIAAPAEARAKCGLALRATPDRCQQLELVLRAQGVEFRTFGA